MQVRIVDGDRTGQTELNPETTKLINFIIQGTADLEKARAEVNAPGTDTDPDVVEVPPANLIFVDKTVLGFVIDHLLNGKNNLATLPGHSIFDNPFPMKHRRPHPHSDPHS